jgi:Aerotolerance regulator N-terminal
VTFTYPSFLWAFAGLAIPIAIHLMSRKEGKVIRVGSLRHVEESNTSQFKSIRLNEILLLLLRCLMIAAIVLLMSGASCTSDTSGKRTKWLVVEPGIETQADYRTQIDSLVENGYELHYLAPGFPRSPATAENVNYWQLNDELGRLPLDAVVITWSDAAKFKGQRTNLASNIRLITADHQKKEFTAGAWKSGDTLLIRRATTDPFGTSYHTKNALSIEDSISIETPERIYVSIVTDKDNENESRVLTAAINVLAKEYKLPVTITKPGDQETPVAKKWLFWLRESQPKLAGDQQVVLSSPGNGPLIERISANVLHLNRKLDQDVAINEGLVIALLKALYPDSSIEDLATSRELNSMPEEFAWSKQQVAAATIGSPATYGIEVYLVILFLLFLATERFVAIQRNQ